MVLTPSLEIASTESETTPLYPQHSLPADRLTRGPHDKLRGPVRVDGAGDTRS
jgi:hypothetical protein